MARKITDPMGAALAFQKGHEDGFNYFFDSLYSALKYYAFKIVNDVPSAEDAVEVSFIRIWERRITFDHPKVIKSWLYTTVRNYCLDILQNRDRIEKKQGELIYLLQDQCEQSVDHNIIRAETINYARNLIEKLPEECKKIFLLMYVEGLTAVQIAKHLKLNISTIKNQKMRGLKILSDWVILGKSPASLLKENTKTKFLVISSLRERGVPFKIIGYKLNMSSSSVASIYRRGQQAL